MALQFILVKAGVGYDISDIVQKVSWSGRKNSPARTLQLTLLDDPALGSENRANIDVYEGHNIIFLEDGNELFRGIIMKQVQTQDMTLSITAYDNAIYLSNNKGSFSYEKKTLTQIFLDICKKYKISRGEVAAVKYKIPEISEINKTIYDIICNAMSQTYKATGERYYIISQRGQLHLLRRKEQITKLVLETGSDNSIYGNISQYSYSKSIEKTKTRLILTSKEGAVIVKWADQDLEDKIGQMQDVNTPDDTLPKSTLKTMAVTMLNELKKPQESINITALGISSIYSGIAVYISIPSIGIGRTFYVDSDTHDWDGEVHTMKLTLNMANDLESINEKGETETDKATDKQATKDAKQAIKDAAKALKAKKAAESKVIKAGSAADKAATAAEKALANAEKAIAKMEKAKTEKQEETLLNRATKYAKTAVTQSAKAQAQYEKAKTAMADAKALLNLAQSTITNNTTYAIRQAEIAADRATEVNKKAKTYL